MKTERPRLARRDSLTGTRCLRPKTGILPGEPRCNAPLTKIESFLVPPVTVVVCPRCDVIEL